jgi:protein gp37
MAVTTIEWTHRPLPDGSVAPGYTFNIVWGCVPVSEACRDCYARAFAERLGLDLWGVAAPRKTFGSAYWRRPLTWNAEAQRSGHRRNVFCSSMADTFEDHPAVKQEQAKLWPLIERTPWLNWLLLTKRPENIMQMVPWGRTFPDNVWVGTSVETQRRARERIPALLEVPAAVHFLSCEPLLEPVSLSPWLPRLEWVIVGGESGPRPRPMQPEWVHALRADCMQYQVPFFFKQWGGRFHNSNGRLLDGQTYNEMPAEECLSPYVLE